MFEGQDDVKLVPLMVG